MNITSWLPAVMLLRIALPPYVVLSCAHTASVVQNAIHREIVSMFAFARMHQHASAVMELEVTIDVRTGKLTHCNCFIRGRLRNWSFTLKK